MSERTDSEVTAAWGRRWESEADMRREACEALGLDFAGYTWPTLLSIMRGIAQRARLATNQE